MKKLGDSREDHQRTGLRQGSRSVRPRNTRENDCTSRVQLKAKHQSSSRQVRLHSRSASRRREIHTHSFDTARRRVHNTVLLTPRVARTTSLQHDQGTRYRASISDPQSCGKRHLPSGRSLRICFRKCKRKQPQLIPRGVKEDRADVSPGKLFQSLIDFFIAILDESCSTN